MTGDDSSDPGAEADGRSAASTLLEALAVDDVTDTGPAPGTRKGTAKRAVALLAAAGLGFVEPTREERRALTIGFAMAGKVLYGAAFDVVQLARDIDLADPADIAANLDAITICEIKSSSRGSIDSDFTGYFFDLTTAELLVAQSLGEAYVFAFVNTMTGAHLELSLTQLLAKARKVYPKWAIRF